MPRQVKSLLYYNAMAEGDWLKNMRKGVYYLTEAKKDFETSYLAVRTLEGRVLSDEEVKRLPISRQLPKEWKKREWTTRKFTVYLQEKQPKRILEIGCGNGWFSHVLSHSANEVYGLDVGARELEQAARCFQKNGLFFLCCDNWSILPEAYFDHIIFNGSVHYFEPDSAFWNKLMSLLRSDGEIHLLDTSFYSKEDVIDAQERSTAYFSSLGESKAVDYYHHLTHDDLPPNAEILYRPSRMLNRLFPARSPFPWIRIQRASYTFK